MFDAIKSRLSRLFGRVSKKKQKEDPAPKVKGQDPRVFLGGDGPGLWASNHLKESANVRGWQFVAIRCIAKMVSQADVQVHYVGDEKTQKRKLKRTAQFYRSIGDKVGHDYWHKERVRVRKFAAQFKAQPRLITGYADPSSVQKAEASPGSGFKKLRTPVPYDDPVLALLRRPNPYWSTVTLFFSIAQQLAITGSCYLWGVRNGFGKIVELYVLPTGLLTPRIPTAEHPTGSYYLSPLSAWGWGNSAMVGNWSAGILGQAFLTGALIDARDVKPIRWPNPLYLGDGLSPMDAASVWVDVANEIDAASWYFMQNSSRPGLIIERDAAVDPDPDDVIQFREDLKADNSGTPNTGFHLVLPKGLRAKDRSKNPTDLDFQGSRIQYRDSNLAIHQVSPIATGIAEAGSYGAFWAAIKQTTEIAVQPMLDLIGGEITEFVGKNYEGPEREVTPQARSIDDPQLLEQRLKTDISAGNVLYVDEYRSIRGLPPADGADGKQFAGNKTVAEAELEAKAQEADEVSSDTGKNGGGGKDTGVANPGKKAAPGRGKPQGGEKKSQRHVTINDLPGKNGYH